MSVDRDERGIWCVRNNGAMITEVYVSGVGNAICLEADVGYARLTPDKADALGHALQLAATEARLVAICEAATDGV